MSLFAPVPCGLQKRDVAVGGDGGWVLVQVLPDDTLGHSTEVGIHKRRLELPHLLNVPKPILLCTLGIGLELGALAELL